MQQSACFLLKLAKVYNKKAKKHKELFFEFMLALSWMCQIMICCFNFDILTLLALEFGAPRRGWSIPWLVRGWFAHAIASVAGLERKQKKERKGKQF